MGQAYVTKPIVTADVPNRNGVTYSREALEEAIAKFNDRDSPQLGEFGQDVSNGTNIDLTRISHEVEKLFFEGDQVMADIKVLETPMGNILKTLLQEAPKGISFGMRGTGVVDSDGDVTNFDLVTVDAVTGTD